MMPGQFVAGLRMYLRFLAALPDYLRNPITYEQAEAIVRTRLAQRDANLLRLLERGIYGNPRSPYIPLLRLAGCELGDLQDLVHRQGVEGTLLELRRAGVYVSFEEFKGRVPIVRQGREIAVTPRDFDNPFTRRGYVAESGGSSGPGTRVEIDLDFLSDVAPIRLLGYSAHGILNAPMAIWAGLLPAQNSFVNLINGTRVGNVPSRWFSTSVHQDSRPALRIRLAASYGLVMVGRALGKPFPWPRSVPFERADIVARWAVRAVRRHGTCAVRTSVSGAVRVALAAEADGLDLHGVVFMGACEPPTSAKVQRITGSGARYVPTYAFTEAGQVGVGCARPKDGNDLHLLEDVLAIIQYPRTVPGFDVQVDAFHFTSLLASAPKILLNVESDDYGVIEPSTCGCPLEQLGYRRHVRQVRSFRKLTGEGVTLVGSDMERILEEVLPACFGGSPLDYQLAEEEDERGLTRLTVVVSPRVGKVDEAAVVERVLEELGRGDSMAAGARAMWRQVGTLRVRRAEPTVTARGKLLPLYPLPRTSASGAQILEPTANREPKAGKSPPPA